MKGVARGAVQLWGRGSFVRVWKRTTPHEGNYDSRKVRSLRADHPALKVVADATQPETITEPLRL